MRVPKIWDTRIDDLQLTIDKLKVSGLRRRNHQCMLTADGEAGDTLLRIFSLNTLPLYRSGLFSLNLWDSWIDDLNVGRFPASILRGLGLHDNPPTQVTVAGPDVNEGMRPMMKFVDTPCAIFLFSVLNMDRWLLFSSISGTPVAEPDREYSPASAQLWG